jgi:norsolorinic acid ketoreductase
MSASTTYLITGANRGITPITPIPHSPIRTSRVRLTVYLGIGLGLVTSLLLRPHTTVIATIRSLKTSTNDLNALPVAKGSKLLIIPFTLSLSSPESSAPALLSTLAENQIPKIDILILNAGLGSSFLPILSTPLPSLIEHFESNTLMPIHLFQALHPLLSIPSKVILISSSLGSIADMEGATPTLVYGISKAGANYFVRKVHFEHPSIVAVAIHPGYVSFL